MKQLIFMVIMTLAGTIGVVLRPFWGVAVYYLFATLRPQFLWQWVLPQDVQWSRYVSIATVGVAVAGLLGMISIVPPGIEQTRRRFGRSQIIIAFFASWIFITFMTARNQDVAFLTFNEYIKIFAMLAVSIVLLHTVDQLYCLVIIAALALGYIGVEVNDLYFRAGTLGIYHNGYGGLDNNGAGLMLAMGSPMCILLWDQMRSRWRWFFLAFTPVIIHAVLMTYSRGAMLSLIVTGPLVAFRCRRRLQVAAFAGVLIVGAIPIMAGQEIQARFFTLEKNDEDDSANSRRRSWAAAWNMALDNPIFGVGIRNANLFSYDYGADVKGRTIHSQYLQIAADNGFVGLGLYLGMLASVWADTRFCRLAVKGRDDIRSRRTYLVATAVETSMAIFCFGGAFLSLENFELPFLLLLLGSQLAAVVKGQLEIEREREKPETIDSEWSGIGTNPSVGAFLCP
jgi:probable O-glycosylation ligase (exosortase A-associated)